MAIAESKMLKNKNLPYIVLIIILALFIVRNDILGNKVQFSGDGRDYFLAHQIVIRNAINSGFFPIWTPFLHSGMPLFANSQIGVISLSSVIGLATPSVFFAQFLNALVHLILLGLGLFFLGRTLDIENKYSFVIAVVGMFSNYASKSIFFAPFQFVGFVWMPFAIMFAIMAVRKKEWIMHSIFSGIFLALQFLEGGLEVFQYTAITVSVVVCFHIVGKSILNRLVKVFLVGIVIFIVTFGLSAIKLFPASELAGSSNRQQAFNYETTLGTHLEWSSLFSTVVDGRSLSEPLKHPIKGSDAPGIGIISILLVFLGFAYFRKKNFLLFLLIAVFGILLITDSPLVWILWKYFPFFNKQKHVIKGLVVLLLALCVLAGYGAQFFVSRFKDKKAANIAYAVLVILLIATSWGFTYNIKMKNPRPEIESVDIMKYMGDDKDTFRFKAWETNGIDWGTNYYSASYSLEDIYGYVNLWNPRYMPEFLSIANSQPAKFFGILNMKYMTSMNPLNISGFMLVEKFPDRVAGCKYDKESVLIEEKGGEHCPDYNMHLKAWGPYLYLNEKFMPRAYAVEHAVLILGDGNFVMQNNQPISAAYILMLNPKFEPSNTVIVRGKTSINDYSLDELKRYDAMILTQGAVADQQGYALANSYASSGGFIPAKSEDFDKMFDSLGGEFAKVEYTRVNYNHYRANVPADRKFLVLSEMFSVFPGWSAKANGKYLDILNANSMNTAVYVGGNAQVIDFAYFPESFKNGLIITSLTALAIIGYFGYSGYTFFMRIKDKVNNQVQQTSGQ